MIIRASTSPEYYTITDIPILVAIIFWWDRGESLTAFKVCFIAQVNLVFKFKFPCNCPLIIKISQFLICFLMVCTSRKIFLHVKFNHNKRSCRYPWPECSFSISLILWDFENSLLNCLLVTLSVVLCIAELYITFW